VEPGSPTVDRMCSELLDALQLGASQGMREHLDPQLKQLLSMLPEPAAWVVTTRKGKDPRLLVLAAEALFVIQLLRDKSLFVVSRTTCRVRRVEHWRDGRKSSWRFELKRCNEPIRLESLIADDGPSDVEEFARALAEHAGWAINDASSE
jgi:hypothetical protein